jgi:DNA (cytosine-5)-methyltransferase 1
MMGYPAGWTVLDQPPAGMTDSQIRNARLKACGNGVVPQQALAALSLLHRAATSTASASAA